jgi:hypothetical protein
MRPSHSRLRAPVLMLILGIGLAAAEAVGHGWHDAILIEVIAVVAAGGYFLVGGIYGSLGDERQQMVRLRAQALAAQLTALAAVMGFLVQLARRDPNSHVSVLLSVRHRRHSPVSSGQSVSFEESPDEVIRNMGSVGLDLRRWADAGLLRIWAARPSAYGLETHLTILAGLIGEHEPTVAVLDRIAGLARQPGFPPVPARTWDASLNGAAADHELSGSCPWPTAQPRVTFRPGDSSESDT